MTSHPPTSDRSETTRGGKGRAFAASAAVAALAVGSFGVGALPATASVSSDAPVVISEVYGGGGNNGAVLNRDFVELLNTSDAAVDLDGWSVQYASASGTSWQVTPLGDISLEAGEHLLVGQAFGTNTALPGFEADVDGSIPMQASNAKVALVDTITPLGVGTGVAALPEVIDYVGYGSANDFAVAAAPATSVTQSAARDAAGTNTANNAADFVLGAPTPTHSGSGTTPTPEPTTTTPPSPSPSPTQPTTPGAVVPIAEIQGTGSASPLVGQTVTTEGVVTAHYPAGGLNGYVIQTAGTGGAIDLATHTASDAIFVYSPAAVGAVALGDTVRITGPVSEFNGLTQIAAGAGAATKIDAATAPAPSTVSWPTTGAQRESLESMLVQLTDDFTVSNTYSTNQYGEVGLAVGSTPLRQPTDAARPGTPEAAAVATDNAARALTLDDGASTNFLNVANSALTPAYVSLVEPVVVGGQAELSGSFIVDYRNNTWKINPTQPLVADGSGADQVVFSNPRTASPQPVGGDLSVASFNVLNYFTTLGESTTGCQTYTPLPNGQANSVRTGCDVRGAWDTADFARQQSKIVTAIEDLDASVVGLMEIENSEALGETKDEAVGSLVAALNAASTPGKWAFVATADSLADVDRDVITNAIIYQTALVKPEGASVALATQSGNGQPFANAREPIGQFFTPADGGEKFFVAVNHFKSKGSGEGVDADQNDGQGASNNSRVRQATALTAWVDEVTTDEDAIFLVGDFNSYTQEDPMQVLYGAGYVNAESEFELGSSSYSFSGLTGSLDHVLLNDVALERATGADIWNINSGESIALEYSRYGYHGTIFWEDATPYRSSDHDPVKVGLSARATAPTEIDILTINDFHGRLEADNGNGVAGAAVIAGAVDAYRDENPNTLFVSAGDNIGASTFTSLIQQDNPTIDTLVASGLDVSAVGNHEFDRGFDDLLNRVIPRFGGNTDTDDVTDAQRELGGAYGLGANVYDRVTGETVLPEYAIKDVDGVKVAFIGTVTEDTATMVDPAGIADIRFGDQLEAANRVAAEVADEADVIILLTHSGAATSNDCADLASDQAGFGALATGASAEIDAIVSAHTHQTYACDVPVAGTDGQTRPVIQASEYGKALGKLEISYDTGSDELISIGGSTFPLVTGTPAAGAYPANTEIAAMVADYVTDADIIGAEPVGEISADILRGGTPPGGNRGVESSMGNWVSDVYLWATSENPAFGGKKAQIALMNPGGLRADLLYGADGVVTYKEAALVQPFANTLVTVTLTGAQIEEILEQQWKATGDRPKLHLGVSEGFTYEYVQDADPRSGRVVSMSYQGDRIAPSDTFTVVTNSFLANGGDGFKTFALGTDRTDTGQVDLDATLAYFEAFDVVDPAPLGRAIVTTDEPGTENPGTGEPVTEAPNGSWASVTLNDRVEQGGVLNVTVTGLKPGQLIGATLFSEPLVVTGIPVADASGRTSFAVAIPSDFALGAHELVITTAGESPIRVGVTVLAGGQLAVTGSELPLGIAFAAGFLLVAGGLTYALRRRSPVTR